MSVETVVFGLQVIARSLWYAAAFVLLGAFGVEVVASRISAKSKNNESTAPAKRVVLIAALALAVIALGRLLLQAYAVFGIDEGLTVEGIRIVAFDTSWGTGWGWQFAAAGVATGLGATAMFLPNRRALFGGAALFVCVTVPLTGHAVAEPWPWLWVSVQVGHVAGGGVWMGTLAMLLFLLLPKTHGVRHEYASEWVDAFSPLALAGASIVIASGFITTLGYLDSLSEVWATAYGRVIVLKLALVAGVVSCGAYNWRRVRPRLPKDAGREGLRRWALAELTFAALVLVVTAALVALAKGEE